MKREIEVKRLTFDTIFRFVAFGIVFSIMPFSILMGVLSLFGLSTLTWNDQLLTGISGLIASPFIGLFMSVVFTVFFGIFISFGLWLFSKLKPFTVRYIVTPNGQR